MQAQHFVQNLINQANAFHPTICLNTKVEQITKQGEDFCYINGFGRNPFF